MILWRTVEGAGFNEIRCGGRAISEFSVASGPSCCRLTRPEERALASAKLVTSCARKRELTNPPKYEAD